MKILTILCYILMVCTFLNPEIQAQDVEILGSGHIKNVSDPVDDQDAATKAYVDNMLLSFGVSVGSVGIQGLLDVGYCPLDIITAGASKDSLYGKMYQGGLIFYLDDQDIIPGIKGLVAAPTDQSISADWGCSGTDLPDVPNVPGFPPSGLGAEIGDGVTNTDFILNVNNCPTAPAALACTGYMGGGFPDWFLPSAKELNEMYMKIGQGAPAPNTNIGGFTIDFYQSSTELDNLSCWIHNFSNGFQNIDVKTFGHSVRAVRAF